MELLKGWQTIIFNILVVIFGSLEAADWTNVIPTEYLPIFLAGVGIVNMILRLRTNTPVGSKE